MRITCLYIVSLLLSLGIHSCSRESVADSPVPACPVNECRLSYCIPNATSTATRAASYVEPTGKESTVEGLHLLFFRQDDHGNGGFVASAAATLTASDQKENSINFTLPDGTDAETDYDVLVVANLSAYLSTDALTTYLSGFSNDTYGQAWTRLQAPLPQAGGLYGFPSGGLLPMSGTVRKLAGKDELSVELLRVVVRIDLQLSGALSGVTLSKAQLRNVSPVVPYFRNQGALAAPRISSDELTVTDNRVLGGLYALDSWLDVSDSRVLASEATCLLVCVKAPLHTGADEAKTWYRINLHIDAIRHTQYLQRNNAYTVVITSVDAAGSPTPDDAYHGSATQIGSVTLPTDWKTPDGVTPPTVEI